MAANGVLLSGASVIWSSSFLKECAVTVIGKLVNLASRI